MGGWCSDGTSHRGGPRKFAPRQYNLGRLLVELAGAGHFADPATNTSRLETRAMNEGTGQGVALPRRLHELLASRAKEHSVLMEALAHAMLVLSLTDANMTQRSVEFVRHLGNLGASRLEQKGF